VCSLSKGTQGGPKAYYLFTDDTLYHTIYICITEREACTLCARVHRLEGEEAKEGALRDARRKARQVLLWVICALL
jgi:hypothetical protein